MGLAPQNDFEFLIVIFWINIRIVIFFQIDRIRIVVSQSLQFTLWVSNKLEKGKWFLDTIIDNFSIV